MARGGKGQERGQQEDLSDQDPDAHFEREYDELVAYLSAPETDWDTLYVRLKLSPLGSDFTPESFLATPVRTLKWLVSKVTEHEQYQHNLTAHGTAILNNQVMWALYGMGGGKGPKPKASYKDFLPFPEVLAAEENKAKKARLNQTRKVLTQLLQTGELPYDIVLSLWQGPDGQQT